MEALKKIKDWLYPPKYDPDVIVEDVRARMGYTKGGMYAGIMHIPGDPNKSWEEGKDSMGDCPACGGVMRSMYQLSDEEYDGEFVKYYKQVCKECNFLNDTGRMMSSREARASVHIFCDVVKATTFNRTGHNCCFVTNFMDMVDVATKFEECEECPHPY